MQLAIPSPPRQVRLAQVPGALARLAVVAGVALAATLAAGGASLLAGGWLSRESDFFARAVEVDARLYEVKLPPFEAREREPARASVLYLWEGRERSVSGVLMEATVAEGLGPGASLKILVDPQAPERPREAAWARAQAGLRRFLPLGLGLGALLGVLLVARELRRALRRELQPLRTGMLVWLTPDEELPRTKGELVFPGHYYREDVKHAVKARARPGRAPVQNGGKLLAAVVPAEPDWVRVIDEDLAKDLGWYR